MNKLEQLKAYQEKAIRKARKHLIPYSSYMMPNFDWQHYHKVYYEVLDRFAKGEIKNLMISMPPQHGKSQGSTRFLPSFMLGLNPDLRIAVTSYNATIARKFNRDNQRIIDSDDYRELFKETHLSASNVVTVSTNYLRNSEEFEIVNHKGTLKAVGRGGALTSITLDCVIMDDLYKDYSEGNSPVIRESAWDWYTTVVKTRLHNDSQQLIVFTRWHEEDVIGRIEASEKVTNVNCYDDLDKVDIDSWVKINFEAIKDSKATEFDPRKIGQSLWENKHNKKKLLKERKLNPNKFECLYQGNPESKEGMNYPNEWLTYTKLPENIVKRGNYTDTADSGDDYLCSVSYVVCDNLIYVTDVLYTLDSMDITEDTLPAMLNSSGTIQADIESNNGGRYFARNIGKKTNCSINSFYQKNNKESRILSNSAQVQQKIIFPLGWESKWTIFAKHLKGYKRLFKANRQDGAPDVLTGIIEKNYILEHQNYSPIENTHTKHTKGDFTGNNAAPWNAEVGNRKNNIFL